MIVSKWRGRWMRAASALAVLLALLACAAPVGIGRPGTSQGDGTPCATNTPHVTLAQGGRILALVFLEVSRQTTATSTAGTGPTSNTSEIVCILRADDGALVTHYDIGATGVDVMPPRSLLAVAPDSSVLYVSSISPETQSSKLCAVGALTGSVLWCMRMVGYIEQAAVDNGALYLLENGTLEALDAMSGAVLWQRSGFDADQLQPIVLDGDRIYAPTSDGVTLFDELCAFRAKDGTPTWCTNTYFDRTIFQFSVGGGYVTMLIRLTSTLLVQELRESDGRQLWQQQLTEIQPEQTLNAGPTVYIEGARVDQKPSYVLLALNAASGEREWLRDDQSNILSLVGGTDGFVAMRDGTALGFIPASATSPAPVWQTTLTQGGGERLFVTPQSVYYVIGGSAAGALRLRDGRRLWEASCTPESDGTSAHDSNGATHWCHWPNANVGFEMGTVSGSAVI